MRKLISISFVLLLAAVLLYPQDMIVIRRKAAAASTEIADCSGPMTYTGSTGCTKREIFEGVTSCYSGFSSNCSSTWYYANGVTFNSTTSPAPLQVTYSLYVPDAGGSKAFLGYTAASDVYGGAAVNFAGIPATTNINVIRVDTAADTTVCTAGLYGATVFQVSNTGGTTQTTTVSLSTGTTYYMKVRAVPGSGSNARCDAWLSTNGTSWGYSVSSTNGTWTANTGYFHMENTTGTTSAHFTMDDFRIASTSFNYW
jgi:hypothetical protein